MKTILVLTDFSKKADHAAEYALNLSYKLKSNILLCNVFTAEHVTLRQKLTWALEELFSIEGESKKQIKELANTYRQKTEEHTTEEFKPKIKCLSKPGNVGNLGSSLKDIPDHNNIWLIVMGAKTEDCLSNFIFGTNAYSVISEATCPVLFVPPGAPIKDISRIAIATDLKQPELSPLLFLTDFKSAYNLDIILAHVSVSNDHQNDYSEEGLVELALYDITENIEYPKILFQNIQGTDVDDDLRRFALKSKIDILGVIHRKENVFHRLFHSSTTKLLIDSAQLPLLVFPEAMKKISV